MPGFVVMIIDTIQNDTGCKPTNHQPPQADRKLHNFTPGDSDQGSPLCFWPRIRVSARQVLDGPKKQVLGVAQQRSVRVCFVHGDIIYIEKHGVVA